MYTKLSYIMAGSMIYSVHEFELLHWGLWAITERGEVWSLEIAGAITRQPPLGENKYRNSRVQGLRRPYRPDVISS